MGYRGIIIGVTAHALGTDIAEFVRHGVNAVVTKPVNVGTLLDIIERNLTDPSITVASIETMGSSGNGSSGDGGADHGRGTREGSGDSGAPHAEGDADATVAVNASLDMATVVTAGLRGVER